MAQFRLGCVPYVNARPLVAAFDKPNEFVEVVYDVPSKLPAMLDAGDVDAVLVSSIELLRRDDLMMAGDLGIMSYGPVKSVRMLSKVPLNEIKTLALDQSSMTSNLLAQILLAEQGVFPETSVAPPNAVDMLASHDACILIGDNGFEADGTGLIDTDLGAAWTELTALPFVWALWLGRKERRLDAERLVNLLYYGFQASGFQALHSYLDRNNPMEGRGVSKPGHEEKMREWSDETAGRREYVILSAMKNSNWTHDQVEDYLSNAVRYQSGLARKSLQAFSDLLERHKLATVHQPRDESYGELKRQIYSLIPER